MLPGPYRRGWFRPVMAIASLVLLALGALALQPTNSLAERLAGVWAGAAGFTTAGALLWLEVVEPARTRRRARRRMERIRELGPPSRPA